MFSIFCLIPLLVMLIIVYLPQDVYFMSEIPAKDVSLEEDIKIRKKDLARDIIRHTINDYRLKIRQLDLDLDILSTY